MAALELRTSNESPQPNDHYIHLDEDLDLYAPETDILTLENLVPSPYVPDEDDATLQNSDSFTKAADDNDDVELSPGGILDEETVARGLSNLGLSADGIYQVYLDVTIPGFSLVDIGVLGEFAHLQRVEISHNNISDLSPLSKLPYLLYLNASHNNISQLLNFAPPFNLLEVDLSYNQINNMSDLSAHHALRKLVLDNNLITEIKGLENCQCLKSLSLAHNHLEAIQGLDNLPLQYLNLCHNMIKRIENIGSLNNLRNLNLSGNKVRSLQGLEGHNVLESIDLEDNEVIDIVEIQHIQQLGMLRELNLLRNPIQELPYYRLAILFHIPRLCLLDRHKVEVEEKVSAKNTFDASLEVIAARDHIMHVVYSFLQPQRIWDSTLPSVETPYPMLVLVGPQGSGKKELSMKLVEEFADYFGYGVSHTTRLPRPHEENGKDYYFVSLERFEIDVKMGQFIQTHKIDDTWYGLQMESIECVAREGLACVIHMELEGVLTLKNTYFEPRYVLIIPLEKEAYERRLQQCGLYTESQIEHILRRADLYCKYNQDHPGFFDMMISSEDIAEAYHKLRRLVMDYLGISSLSPVAQANNMNEAGKSETQHAASGETSTNQTTGQSRPKLSGTEHTSPTRCHVSSAVGKGIVEEESIRRRQSAAKEVVTGYVPPIYEQLLAQYPRMTPEQQGVSRTWTMTVMHSSIIMPTRLTCHMFQSSQASMLSPPAAPPKAPVYLTLTLPQNFSISHPG
ncbi:leucine-rich repeat and guanylate kinase domain-containing protein-like [Pomacea canaliculata]|uniref:leucine-rich repeat and guanylate kinase domain-containing protein-like n=1 Tax=Pomacea canaliculata TaxID=400727 RepID=UPI000D73B0FD|nr:leucine-rich repeat and guanylate kinase domain-containing protein-like [Pomacea canaliculata]